jgi:hypothetical protein
MAVFSCWVTRSSIRSVRFRSDDLDGLMDRTVPQMEVLVKTRTCVLRTMGVYSEVESEGECDDKGSTLEERRPIRFRFCC